MALTKVGSAGVDHPAVTLEEDLDAIKKTASDTINSSASTTSILNVQVPKVRHINGIPLTGDVELTDTVLDIYTKKVIDTKLAAIESTGYNPVYLNGYLLDKDVTLTAGDVGSYSNAQIAAKRAGFIPTTRKVANKALSANIIVNSADVGAYTKTQIDAKMTGVLPTRTINTVPLDGDITLRAGDIGTFLVADVVPRTFKVNGVALTGAGITLSAASGSYTKPEFDALLTGYIPLVNKWGLGTRAIAQTSPESGFYSYTTGGPEGSSSGVKIVAGKGVIAFPSDLPGVWYSKDSVNFSKITSGAAAPLPNYWAPLKDSLSILTGEGPLDTISVNGTAVEIPSRSVGFSRASTATYIARDGNLKVAAVNEPRFEKDGLLLETQSTNFVPYSGEFNPTGGVWNLNYWDPDHVPTIEPVEGGYFKVTTLEEYGSGVWLSSGLMGLVEGTTYTLSFDILVLSGMMYCGWEDSLNGIPFGNLTPENSSELRRLSITVTKGEKSNIVFYAGDVEGHLDVASEFVIGRIQVEEGSVATSYIPTTGVAGTRAADLAYIPEGLNIPLGTDVSTVASNLTTAVTIGRWETDSWRPMLLSGSKFGYVVVGSDSVEYKAYRDPLVIFKSTGRPEGIFVLRANMKEKRVTTVVNGKLHSDLIPEGSSSAVAVPDFRLSTTTGSPGNNIKVMHLSNLRLWHRALTDDQMRGLS